MSDETFILKKPIVVLVKSLLYLSNSVIPSNTANSVQVMKMCEQFGQYFNTHLVSQISAGKKYEPYGVEKCFSIQEADRADNRYIGALQYTIDSSRLINRITPDIIYARYPYPIISCSSGCEIVLEVHQPPSHYIRGRLEKHIFEKPNFSKLVCISEQLKSWYISNYDSLDHSDIVTAHDASDDFFKEKPIENKVIKSDKFIVGYVGSFNKGKGIDKIMSMADKMPKTRFDLVGGTPSQINDWENTSPKNVHFHGHVPHRDLFNMYAEFNVVLAPYAEVVHPEGGNTNLSNWMSPLKIFEYMSARKPIICSDLPVIREVLEDDYNSLLVSPDDINQWVDAIHYIQNNPASSKNIAKNARKDYVEAYTWEKRTKKIISKALSEGVIE